MICRPATAQERPCNLHVQISPPNGPTVLSQVVLPNPSLHHPTILIVSKVFQGIQVSHVHRQNKPLFACPCCSSQGLGMEKPANMMGEPEPPSISLQRAPLTAAAAAPATGHEANFVQPSSYLRPRGHSRPMTPAQPERPPEKRQPERAVDRDERQGLVSTTFLFLLLPLHNTTSLPPETSSRRPQVTVAPP